MNREAWRAKGGRLKREERRRQSLGQERPPRSQKRISPKSHVRVKKKRKSNGNNAETHFHRSTVHI